MEIFRKSTRSTSILFIIFGVSIFIACTNKPTKEALEYFKKARRAENQGSIDRAERLYAKACEGNHAEACYESGTILEKSNLTDKAITQFERGCDLDNEGCISLVDIYLKKNNLSEAKKYALKMCNSGNEITNAIACTRLGVIYYKESNKVEALKYWQKACDGGSFAACNNIGIYKEREEKDIEGAIRYFKEACQGKVREGCTQYYRLIKASKK